MELLVAKMFALGATIVSQSEDIYQIWLDQPDLVEQHNVPTHLSAKLGKVISYTVEKDGFVCRHSMLFGSWYYSMFREGFDRQYYCDDKVFAQFTDLSKYIRAKKNK